VLFSLALVLVLEDKFWVLGLGLEGQVLSLGIEQKSLALQVQCCTGPRVPLDITQVRALILHLRATQTMTWRQLRLYATVTLITLSLWHCLIKCLLHELVPPLSYFLLVLCSLAPHNLKRSLNIFWRQVPGLEAQVLVNNTECMFYS